MKNIKGHIIMLSLIGFCFYAGNVFAAASFNPSEWDAKLRTDTGIGMLFVFIIAIFGKSMYDAEVNKIDTKE